MLVAGAFGTLWAGRLADRFDRRYVITISLAGSMLFALAIVGLGFFAPTFAALVPVAALLGFALGSSAGVLVVLGQEYLPKRIGVASGVTLGLAVTIGGLAAPAFGYIGDHDGLIAVFGAIFVCGLAAMLASFALPKPSGVERA
jgi:FSR family fosmidomycin resistance protein-like MFS transporter